MSAKEMKVERAAAAPLEPATLPPLLAPSGLETFVVDAQSAGDRLDRYLSRAAAERGLAFSRTRIKALIEAGAIEVEAAVERSPSLRLAEGARISFAAPAPEEAAVAGEDLPLEVIYEDEWLIVVNKPAGLVVHPAPGHARGTLVNALIRHCRETLSGIGGVRRPGIVHRLDKDTSGLLVVAKTDAAHRGLAELFADHGRTRALERRYLAIVWAPFEIPAGKVNAAIGRDGRRRDRMAVALEQRGRHAVTHWEVVEALGPATLVACALETGRTHQIRVHMASIGHPLLGDSAYGSGFKTKSSQLSEGAKAALAALGRQALHAATLAFDHPITGEAMRFDSVAPADFSNLVKALREQRWTGASSP